MGSSIYVADDEQDILDVICDFLVNAGYEVSAFHTGDALFSAFREKPCDLVILDIMMPGTDGLTICKNLRRISTVPIIILTAKESEADHMRGFMLGGDDYIIKPFSPSLLVVRVKALLRRVEMSRPKDVAADEDVHFGDLVYSQREHMVLCRGADIGLTMTEMALFGCLIKDASSPISRDDLLDRVWGIENNDVETRVTDETVRRIRKKLLRAGSRVKISSVWGFGYRLDDPEI